MCAGGDATEAEDRSDEGDDEEDDGVVHHWLSLLVVGIGRPVGAPCEGAVEAIYFAAKEQVKEGAELVALAEAKATA